MAILLRRMPFTMVKSPPITTHLPSGLVAIAYTGPFRVGANAVGLPVVRSKAATYVRTVSGAWPDNIPGCRRRVNSPPAKTVLPAIASAFTLLLVCHDGCLIAETAEAN